MNVNPQLPKFFYVTACLLALIKLFIAWFSKDAIEAHPLLWDASTYLIYAKLATGFILNLLVKKN